MNKRRLFLFTESYPYGKGESFVKSDLECLDKLFDVIIVPLNTSESLRKVEGLNVDNYLGSVKLLEYFWPSFRSMLSYSFLETFWKVVFGFKPIRSLRYLISYHFNYGKYSTYFERKVRDGDVLFTYWLKHGAYAVAKFNKSVKKYSRAHRADFYESIYQHPYHLYISEKLDGILVVSAVGKSYFLDKYKADSNKLKVRRLGTKRSGDKIIYPTSKSIQTVTCSNCIPLKRNQYIFDALIEFASENPNTHITHTHFGDGPLLKEYKKSISKASKNIEFIFRGQTSNEEIHEFYSNEAITAFINFSTIEGVPVSIMEVLSYGIPVIASDVGGTSEIVNQTTGILVDVNSFLDLQKAVFKVLKTNYDREKIFEFWDDNCNSVKLCTKLITTLSPQIGIKS